MQRAERTPAVPEPPPAGAPASNAPVGEVRASPNLGRTAAWIATIVTLAALALAKDILVPLALAGLIAYLLLPLATWLERRHVRRGLAAVVSVLALGSVLGGLLVLLANQAQDLSDALPRYREQLQHKAEVLEGTTLGGSVRAAEALDQLGDTISPPTAGEAPGPKPMKVEVVERRPRPLDRTLDLLGPVLPMLGLTVVVLLVAVFLLTYRLDLRERFIRVVSLGEIVVTASALDDANGKISRYLLMMLFVNSVFGATVAVALYALGLPNALLWGFLAGLLRFVPLVGVWIAAVAPVLLSIAIFDGWGSTLAILGIWAVAEVLVANLLEPLVIGWRTGLSPFAVVLGTLLWTWLWGPAGLLLAVPMTLCLAVAGRHFRPLRFVSVLFGSEASLSAPHRLYERLLATDADGARQALRTAVAETSADAAIDNVLAPALAVATADRRREALGAERLEEVCRTARLVADELGEGPPEKRVVTDAGEVLLVPLVGCADAVLADVLAARLQRLGLPVECLPPTTLSGELADRIARDPPAVLVLVGLLPLGALWTRYLSKRLRARAPKLPVAAVLWPEADAPAPAPDADLAGWVDPVTHHVADAVERIRLLAERPAPPPASDTAPPAAKRASAPA